MDLKAKVVAADGTEVTTVDLPEKTFSTFLTNPDGSQGAQKTGWYGQSKLFTGDKKYQVTFQITEVDMNKGLAKDAGVAAKIKGKK